MTDGAEAEERCAAKSKATGASSDGTTLNGQKPRLRKYSGGDEDIRKKGPLNRLIKAGSRRGLHRL